MYPSHQPRQRSQRSGRLLTSEDKAFWLTPRASKPQTHQREGRGGQEDALPPPRAITHETEGWGGCRPRQRGPVLPVWTPGSGHSVKNVGGAGGDPGCHHGDPAPGFPASPRWSMSAPEAAVKLLIAKQSWLRSPRATNARPPAPSVHEEGGRTGTLHPHTNWLQPKRGSCKRARKPLIYTVPACARHLQAAPCLRGPRATLASKAPLGMGSWAVTCQNLRGWW